MGHFANLSIPVLKLVHLADGLHVIARHGSPAPFVLRAADGRRADSLQVGEHRTRGFAAPSHAVLETLLREYADEKGLKAKGDVEHETHRLLVVTGTFHSEVDGLLRAWAISDGAHAAIILLGHDITATSDDLDECERVIRSCTWRAHARSRRSRQGAPWT